MNTRLKTLSKGIIDVSPLMIPVFPFGIIYGVIGIELGIGPYMTLGLSIIIFGGASQIVLLQLFSGGASSLVILSSVGAVNSRHLLYGAVLSEHLSNLKITWKIILSYLLTDQAFAVSNNYLKENENNQLKHYHLLGSGLTLWTIWQISTLLGVFLGSIVPEELGLAYTIPLTFIALLVNYFRKIDHIIVILISGTLSLMLFNAPLKSYIILSTISALLAGFIIIKFKKGDNQ